MRIDFGAGSRSVVVVLALCLIGSVFPAAKPAQAAASFSASQQASRRFAIGVNSPARWSAEELPSSGR